MCHVVNCGAETGVTRVVDLVGGSHSGRRFRVDFEGETVQGSDREGYGVPYVPCGKMYPEGDATRSVPVSGRGRVKVQET